MVLGEIETVEVVPLGLGLGPHGAGEAELLEDVADLDHDLRNEMQPAGPRLASRHAAIQAVGRAGGVGEGALARGERRFQLLFQGIGGAAHRFALRGGERGEGFEDLGEGAGLPAQQLVLQLLEPARIRLRNFLETLPQLVEAHYRAFFATSASCSNAWGSRTARSARILRLISTPALRRPFIKRLYDSACNRAAALMRVIQRRRKKGDFRRLWITRINAAARL